MAEKSIWTEEVTVRISETDLLQRWKPAYFFQALIEAASRHAGSFGFHFKDMFAQDFTWVLSRIKIYFYRFPLAGETVTIRTWPKGVQQKLFFMRDFQLSGEDGQPIATATSAWLLINLNTRRIMPPQALPGNVPDNDGYAALDEPLEKIAARDGASERLVIEARYSDIDLMGHVNNTRYIEWICDCFALETWGEKKLEWLQINYVNEVRPGDRVSVSLAEDGSVLGQFTIQGTNENTGARAFEAAIHWSENNPTGSLQ